MFNQVTLMGRVATDINKNHTDGGSCVVNFRLAVDRPLPMGASRADKKTDFIDMVAWRGVAEFISSHVEKGQLLLASGVIQVRERQGSDMKRHRNTEVLIKGVRVLQRPYRKDETVVREEEEYEEEGEEGEEGDTP